MELHTQLARDCHHLGHFPCCEVLLHRNSSVMWFILVPETDLPDLLDLPPELSAKVMGECRQIAGYLKTRRKYPKVNIAALGNVVPQLHVHIVGRHPDDACWPKPVWGNLPESEPYTQAALREIQQELNQLGNFAVEPI